MKETAAKVTEVASRTRAGRAAEQLRKEWEIAAVGLPKVREPNVIRTRVIDLDCAGRWNTSPACRCAMCARDRSTCCLVSPQDMWGRIMWLWDRPTFKRLRIAFSMANISVRLPAIIALVGTQIGLLATQAS